MIKDKEEKEIEEKVISSFTSSVIKDDEELSSLSLVTNDKGDENRIRRV